MKNLKLVFLAAIVLIMSSCASVYHSPNSKKVSSKHQKIAIVPPVVSIPARKRVDLEVLKEQQKTESLNFQKEMYSWLLKRKMQKGIQVNILDIATTNAKLTKAGYFESNTMTPSEIATVLGVDAIITSNYSLSKPISEGGAIALGLLVDVWAPTNQASVTFEIHDKEIEDMIWSYNHTVSGSIGSSPANLVNVLMRKSSRQMPYL